MKFYAELAIFFILRNFNSYSFYLWFWESGQNHTFIPACVLKMFCAIFLWEHRICGLIYTKRYVTHQVTDLVVNTSI